MSEKNHIDYADDLRNQINIVLQINEMPPEQKWVFLPYFFKAMWVLTGIPYVLRKLGIK